MLPQVPVTINFPSLHCLHRIAEFVGTSRSQLRAPDRSAECTPTCIVHRSPAHTVSGYPESFRSHTQKADLYHKPPSQPPHTYTSLCACHLDVSGRRSAAADHTTTNSHNRTPQAPHPSHLPTSSHLKPIIAFVSARTTDPLEID